MNNVTYQIITVVLMGAFAFISVPQGIAAPQTAPQTAPPDCPTNTTRSAAGICVPKEDAKENKLGLSGGVVNTGILTVLNWTLGFLAGLTILMIVGAGIMYMTATGDQDRIDNAKRWLFYAIIGLTVALLSWIIVNGISGILGAGITV